MRNQLDNFEEAGLTFKNVVAANVYLDNVDDFAQDECGLRAVLQGPVKPARTTIQQIAPGKRDADANGSYPTLEQVSFVAVRYGTLPRVERGTVPSNHTTAPF